MRNQRQLARSYWQRRRAVSSALRSLTGRMLATVRPSSTADKPNNLDWIQHTERWEERRDPIKLSLVLHIHTMAHACVHKHTHTPNNI